MGEYLEIPVEDVAFSAFVEFPAVLPAPSVVVLHEVFGVNNDMRSTCRELAGQGFIAVCPDLFWRQEPGLDLSHWTEAEWQKGLALYQAYDRDQGVRDLTEVLRFAGALPGASGKVGVMGYCLGGLMTFLVTARVGADASVAYYPGSAEQYLAEADAVTSPMIVHLAGEDEFIPPEARHAISSAFADNALVTVHGYPACSHAFARHSGVHFDAAAAALANGRTFEFLRAHLS